MASIKKYIVRILFPRLIAAGIALSCLSSPVHAASTQSADIHVSIVATKSLSVNTTFYSFGALNPSTGAVSASSITVTNDSNVLIETYTIQGANAISDSGSVNWTLASSTGTNQFALAAEFSNSAPANTNAAFANSDTTTSPITCSATVFGNGNVSESGSAVSPTAGSNTRGLWFRIRTPNIITDYGAHTITITLAVL